VKELATFGCVVGVFFSWKFKLILRILKWSANKRKKNILLSNKLP